MAAIKPSVPKGTRDFSPAEMVKRNYIFDTIKSVFRKYGYQQIETPTMENLSTLTGKYGDEGDKLIFKVLNIGDYLAKAEGASLRSNRSLRPLRGNASERDHNAFQTFPGAAGLACRPPAERPLPRILPV
jgi:hypothetical protein